MHEFTKKYREKDWSGKYLANWWGITPRRLSQIAANPSRRDLDALAGLPKFDPSLHRRNQLTLF